MQFVYIAFYYFTTVSFCNIVETSLYNGLKVSSCEVPVSLYVFCHWSTLISSS